MAFTERGPLQKASGEFFRVSDLGKITPKQLTYLFSIDEQAFYLVSATALRAACPDAQELPRNALRTYQPQWLGFAAATCEHLAKWYAANKRCGACGAALKPSPTERALVCPKCAGVVYPRLNPAVIIAIHDDERLLLTGYANRTNTPHWALVAGYVEFGETLEDTVRREAYEETGLKVKNLRYFGSQPWAFSQSLLMGFFAELDGSDAIKMQTSELARAKWFKRAEIPPLDNLASLTNTMITAFAQGKEQG